jgi:soluble lytic murein transglycosylase-like protein
MCFGKTFILIILTTFCMQSGIVHSAEKKDLSYYVQKYRQVEISRGQLNKLLQYNHLIEHFSSVAFFKPRHKVNPDFIRALILAESSVDPQALSYKNARGLSQILYETGKAAAKEIASNDLDFQYVSSQQLKDLKPDDLYDPAVNILLACYLVSKYNFKFQGKLDLVIAAWNAGENSITNNQAPPYSETLNLIGKVNGYFNCLLKEQKNYNNYARQ